MPYGGDEAMNYQSPEPIPYSEDGFSGCPFCGEPPMIFEIPAHSHGHFIMGLEKLREFPGAFYAECVVCEFYMSAGTLEELQDKWNHRTPAPEAPR